MNTNRRDRVIQKLSTRTLTHRHTLCTENTFSEMDTEFEIKLICVQQKIGMDPVHV